MKSSGFNSIEQEEIAGYEPVGSGIKFDTQDDELERIINLRANAVKNDIQKIRDKNNIQTLIASKNYDDIEMIIKQED